MTHPVIRQCESTGYPAWKAPQIIEEIYEADPNDERLTDSDIKAIAIASGEYCETCGEFPRKVLPAKLGWSAECPECRLLNIDQATRELETRLEAIASEEAKFGIHLQFAISALAGLLTPDKGPVEQQPSGEPLRLSDAAFLP